MPWLFLDDIWENKSDAFETNIHEEGTKCLLPDNLPPCKEKDNFTVVADKNINVEEHCNANNALGSTTFDENDGFEEFIVKYMI